MRRRSGSGDLIRIEQRVFDKQSIIFPPTTGAEMAWNLSSALLNKEGNEDFRLN